MPRFFSVKKEHKEYLQKALAFAGLGAAGGAGRELGRDTYSKVKSYLVQNNIPHQEHNDTSTVPRDHVHH